MTVLDAVVERMTACELIAAGQERGDPGFVNLGRSVEPQRTRDRLDAFVELKDVLASLI